MASSALSAGSSDTETVEGNASVSRNREEVRRKIARSISQRSSGFNNTTNNNMSTNEGISKVGSKKLGHRRVYEDGEVTYKRFETTQLMGSIQLGLQQSIGSLSRQSDRDLLMKDFMPIETVAFSRDGRTNQTPAHTYDEFKFKTFAPFAFKKFRQIFEIDETDFLVSLCSEPMVELSNPGASGSIFYLTRDDKFICKTVQHKEANFLQKLLPGHYMNVKQNPRTLLPKFFGLYCYCCNAKNVRIVIMNNLLPSGLQMHHKFDLKGSTYKRRASRSERNKRSPTFKDLDYLEMYPEGGIHLYPELYDNLLNAIQRDCRVLESFKIMDYSLLIGVHNLDQAAREGECKETCQTAAGRAEASSSNANERRQQLMGQSSSASTAVQHIAHSTALESITLDKNSNEGRIDVCDSATMGAEDFECPVSINDGNVVKNVWGGIPARSHKGERILLFIGIIDILQSYGMTKKVEHAWKSLIHDGDTVSVHRPSFYARRFQAFMKDKVFRKIVAQPSDTFQRLNSFHRKTSVLHPRQNLSERDEALRSDNKKNSTGIIKAMTSHNDNGSPEEKDEATVTVITIGGEPSTLTPANSTSTARSSGVAGDQSSLITMTSDERVQIFIPSPQSTPYSTITRGLLSSESRSVTRVSNVQLEDAEPLSLSGIELKEIDQSD